MSFLTPPTTSAFGERLTLHYDPGLKRNRFNQIANAIAAFFAALAVVPLFLVLIYVLIQGGRLISLQLLTQLPPAPGLTGGGIGNAILGTIIVTLIAAMIAIPVGVGGGVYLSEYARNGWFSRFVRFGNDVLAGGLNIRSSRHRTGPWQPGPGVPPPAPCEQGGCLWRHLYL